jgi:AraC-like DNA-binding protein
MHSEYYIADNFAKEEILRLLLKLLLLKAERKRHALIPPAKNSEWLLQFGIFNDQLENHITETRNANAYADIMGISYKHLNEICKSISGVTAKDFIDNYLILEIQRQLAISDTSVKELAYKMGFDEPTNFFKYFKKHTNHSPLQFKKNLKK